MKLKGIQVGQHIIKGVFCSQVISRHKNAGGGSVPLAQAAIKIYEYSPSKVPKLRIWTWQRLLSLLSALR